MLCTTGGKSQSRPAEYARRPTARSTAIEDITGLHPVRSPPNVSPTPYGHPPRLLALHGRGSSADRLRSTLVPGGYDAFTPNLDAMWTARPFAQQVADVDGWLDVADVAMGHSWGAWVLLAAAVERVGRGARSVPILLLSPLFGVGRHPGGAAMGFIPPRSRRLGAAVGEPGVGVATIAPGRLAIVHGEADDQVPLANLREAVGDRYRLVVVPGGHRLDHQSARDAVRTELLRVLTVPTPTAD